MKRVTGIPEMLFHRVLQIQYRYPDGQAMVVQSGVRVPQLALVEQAR